MDEWMDGLTDGWMHGYMHECMAVCLDGWNNISCCSSSLMERRRSCFVGSGHQKTLAVLSSNSIPLQLIFIPSIIHSLVSFLLRSSNRWIDRSISQLNVQAVVPLSLHSLTLSFLRIPSFTCCFFFTFIIWDLARKTYLGEFWNLGFPLIWGVFLCILGFYSRNEFIGGTFQPGNPLPKYAHVQTLIKSSTGSDGHSITMSFTLSLNDSISHS